MPQDYDKIFASGATSTQDWTDENYLRGWGYLGQTPPPYQLFDALFKRLDLKTQELKSGQDNISSNYVPLAGGVMTGLLSLFTGSTVPTPNSNDNSKKIPNTEWVQTWIKAYVAELSENLEVQWSGSTFTVPALGITGLMAQNGYISLGKLFGGLILQWGIIVGNLYHYKITYNITFKHFIIPMCFPEAIWSHSAQDLDEAFGVEKNTLTLNGCTVLFSQEGNEKCFWIALGI